MFVCALSGLGYNFTNDITFTLFTHHCFRICFPDFLSQRIEVENLGHVHCSLIDALIICVFKYRKSVDYVTHKTKHVYDNVGKRHYSEVLAIR